MRVKFTWVLSLGCALQLSAQTGNTTDTDSFYNRPLTEITIRENRLQTPFAEQNRNITVLDRSLIRTLPVKSVNELLSYVSGVDVRQRGPWGTQADIGIDGGTFDQTLVLVNGIKVSDPQTGHNMMNLPVPLDAIDHIEVLRGPAARIYGVNGLNGAINIVTRTPSATGITANVYAGSSLNRDSSNNKLYGGYGVQVAGSLKGAHSAHYLSLGQEQASGYRYNSAFRNNKVFYQGYTDLSASARLDLIGGYIYNKFGANGFYSAPGDKEAQETVQTGLLGAGATIKIGSRWTLKPRLSYRYNHDDYIYIRQKPEVYHNRHETHVADAELNNTFLTGIGTFGLGFEGRNERINSSNLGNWQRSNYGFFGEYRFDKVKDLLVNLGAYANYNSDFGWRIMPGIDAGYRVYGGWRLFANAGVGQRLPTYTDWYYKGPLNIGNDQLRPEYSYNMEGGLKYSSTALNASASYFNRRIEGFIDWVKDSLTAPWQPMNVHRINTSGFAFSADYRWNGDAQTDAISGLIAGLSYTYLETLVKDQGTEASQLSRYALENLRHQATARISLKLFRNFGLSGALRYQQRVNYKDYSLLDIRVSYNKQHYSIYADATNLTDVQYIEAGAVPLPGRWITLGFKWSWMK